MHYHSWKLLYASVSNRTNSPSEKKQNKTHNSKDTNEAGEQD